MARSWPTAAPAYPVDDYFIEEDEGFRSQIELSNRNDVISDIIPNGGGDDIITSTSHDDLNNSSSTPEINNLPASTSLTPQPPTSLLPASSLKDSIVPSTKPGYSYVPAIEQRALIE
ncbi:hypothetical protein PGT21_005017 [Puccinia graminis f. sp. tritici]|uniref:Uncharacterized protein n=1 Tax=Puccinia graminis f. sp. tritici TaxID=56615 RepID=A0A5B0PWV7_PUCGR|nr:hypothetical protein PGTUg99_023326 [Puccinia graminis f. sp. tritici]KAA1105378.1 hypothetical protein PGT21_005017 [Puccinia graminis f. sp. tritici]